MIDDIETTVTLRMVYDAVVALVNESQASRAQWQEAETNLLLQAALHRKRLDQLDAELGDVKASAQDHEGEILRLRTWKHELCNKLTPLFADVECLGRRIDALERAGRKDTELIPPPPEPSG